MTPLFPHLHLGRLWRTTPGLKLTMEVAEGSVSHFNFSLCPALLSPHRHFSLENTSGNFLSANLSILQSVSREPDQRHTHFKYKTALGKVKKIILQV